MKQGNCSCLEVDDGKWRVRDILSPCCLLSLAAVLLVFAVVLRGSTLSHLAYGPKCKAELFCP